MHKCFAESQHISYFVQHWISTPAFQMQEEWLYAGHTDVNLIIQVDLVSHQFIHHLCMGSQWSYTRGPFVSLLLK